MQWKSKALKLQNPSKQSRDINKGSNFSSLALIVKHSCGIFTALFSHVNTTSEREDWELCWNSTSTYHQSPGRISLPSGRLSVRGRSGRRKSKKKKKTFATVVLRLWKENIIYFNGFLLRVCVYPHVWIQSRIFKDCFSRKVVYLSLLSE